jgi:transposase
MKPQQGKRYCGMDIHKDTIVVCVLPAGRGEGSALRKTYRSFRNDLIRMRTWLKQLKVTDIAMESTGVYWRPVWNVLEDQGFGLLLVNPAQVKALAGRKSDGRDCKRIAEYLEDGRLDGSFVPPKEIRELRQLVRHRISLLEERNEVHNQIRDLFETASLKLSSVATNLMGVSGRRIIEAMIAGEDSAELLSWKVKGRLRAKEKEVREAMKGFFNDFHRDMLAGFYEHYQFLTSQIEKLEARIAERMKPHQERIELLSGIPGVDKVVAWHLIAELGTDMSVFPSAGHCASWAGLVPGENESAGKKKSTRCRKGNKVLRRILSQAAWGASRKKRGYLRTFFYRIRARQGASKAVIALAHKILVIAYQMLKTNTPYQELGGDYFDRINAEKVARQCIRKLESLGLKVQILPQGGLEHVNPGISTH